MTDKEAPISHVKDADSRGQDHGAADDGVGAKSAPAAKPTLVKRDWLAAAVLLVVIIFIWIGFGVYKALTESKIPPVLREQLRPFSTSLDLKILDNLGGRKRIRTEQFAEEERVKAGGEDRAAEQTTAEAGELP